MVHGIRQKLKSIQPGSYLCGFFIVCVWLLSFEEPLARLAVSGITVFRNLLPVAAVLLFTYRAAKEQHHFSQLLSPFFIAGAVFSASGFIGWLMNRLQNSAVTAGTWYEHLRFWLCLYLFAGLFGSLDIRKYAKTLFPHIAVLSGVTVLSGACDLIFSIWPHQTYRYGIGSIQIFYGHPSNLGAHAVFLSAMLLLLFPYFSKEMREDRIRRILTFVLVPLLLLSIVFTLRIRLIGLAVFSLILFIWMIPLGRRVSLPALLAGASLALLTGWRRLYDFYFSPYAYTMARGQFAVNSLDIAKQNAPFGSGFGTFGSRLAQLNYSPLYYRYHMMTTIGMTPSHPAYACDTFFPCILAESGWLGLAAYAVLIALLAICLLRLPKTGRIDPPQRFACFAGLCLLSFELLDTTGALAFSETYSVLIAIALGLSLAVLRPASLSAQTDSPGTPPAESPV